MTEVRTDNYREKLLEIIDGIDREETYGEGGWWETSTGADFGSKVKAELIALFEQCCAPRNTPKCCNSSLICEVKK